MAIKGGPLRLFDCPIRYLQARVAAGPPRPFPAIVPVVINALFVGSAGMILQFRTTVSTSGLPETATGFQLPIPIVILVALVVGLLGFAVHAGAVIMLDMVTAQSRQARRYVEFCALAYWPQLLYSIPALAATWLYFDPPPIVYRAGADMMATAMDYGAEVASMPFSILMDTARQFAAVWLIALHACALRVVSGLGVGGTWAAGIGLAVLFFAVPWLAGQFMERLFF